MGAGLPKTERLGFPDDGYVLPPLKITEHVIGARTRNPDFLFDMPAVGLSEQRNERRRTIQERCETAAELISHHKGYSVAWCHLNPEGDLLEKLIPNCVQISGDQSDEKKEELLDAFRSGQVKKLVSKPSILGFGQNWQFCDHETFFPSHSFEQWYQAIRRCWRFGQKNTVRVDIISSEGEAGVLANMQRKSAAAEKMFEKLVELINNELRIEQKDRNTQKMEKPSWL
jgi:hypothetical protein